MPNSTSESIEQFIEKDLLDSVAKELTSGALAQEAGLEQQLAEATAQIKENIGEDALDAEGNLDPKYHNSKPGKAYLTLSRMIRKDTKSNPAI